LGIFLASKLNGEIISPTHAGLQGVKYRHWQSDQKEMAVSHHCLSRLSKKQLMRMILHALEKSLSGILVTLQCDI